MLKIGTQNRAYLLSSTKTMRFIYATELASILARFNGDRSCVLRASYRHGKNVRCHFFEGGPLWMPTLPKEIAKPGDELDATVSVVNTKDFIRGLPPTHTTNAWATDWMSRRASFLEAKLEGRTVSLIYEQFPSVEGFKHFVIRGRLNGEFGSKSGLTFLGFSTRDAVGQAKRMRIYHDGSSKMQLAVFTGHYFSRVTFVSFDGVRLKMIYRTETEKARTTTTYLKKPSSLFKLTSCSKARHILIDGIEASLVQGKVRPVRGLEHRMLNGSRYDHGRLGAEIAYTAAAKSFGPDNVVMMEPSLGGRDLYTQDGKVVIQARMIAHYGIPTKERIYKTIRQQLESLARKLNQDFQFRPTAEKGIAVLTIKELDGKWRLLMITIRRCDVATKGSPGRIRTSVTRSLLSSRL